jgi:glycosyltransferase involved in cell wall biosynthesis
VEATSEVERPAGYRPEAKGRPESPFGGHRFASLASCVIILNPEGRKRGRLQLREQQRERMVTKLLKELVPAPLRPPVRGAVLLLVPPLQRRLRRAWRRRNRLKTVWRRQLKPKLKPIERRRLKQKARLHVWRLRLWDRHSRDRADESSNHIHLICPILGHRGGGPLRALHLFDELKSHREVSLWSEQSLWSEREPDREIAARYPVKSIVPERFEFPKTGTFVFVSSYFPVGPWIQYTHPRRIVLIHNNNSMTPREFHRKLRQLSNNGRHKIEVMYASELTKKLVGDYPGFVQPSLIDLDKFTPAPSKPPGPGSVKPFTIGRLSRANPKKHHADDPELYRRLVEHGCRVRIMGPSPAVEEELGGLEGSVELLPMFAQEAHLFLQGLDCFFYRTSEGWSEPSGRVVTEAMACALPVVCHESGGYAEVIEHGRNGFLFDTQQEALEILLGLKEDRQLRESVGAEARRTAEGLFSSAVRTEIVEFYLR